MQSLSYQQFFFSAIFSKRELEALKISNKKGYMPMEKLTMAMIINLSLSPLVKLKKEKEGKKLCQRIN